MAEPVQIAVLIPSRGRPEKLARMIGALHRQETGKNPVRYVVGADIDDPDTIAAAMDLWKSGLPVQPTVAARQPSLGGLCNLLATKAPADVYTCLGDDTVVLTDGWDEVIADAWRANPDSLWWWSCANEAAFPIISEKWRAAAGRLFTDYFPFWYDDVWLIEVHRYATGKVGDRLDTWLSDTAPGTHRMRDLAFWDEFFWSRRDERKADAERIRQRLGWPPVADIDALSIEKNPDFDPVALEARQGDQKPADTQYLNALHRARALMAA
jgi:hypothetical protein